MFRLTYDEYWKQSRKLPPFCVEVPVSKMKILNDVVYIRDMEGNEYGPYYVSGEGGFYVHSEKYGFKSSVFRSDEFVKSLDFKFFK